MGAMHLATSVLPGGVSTNLWVKGGVWVDEAPDAMSIHEGGYAIPGLVDAHAHLALASPLAEGSDDELVRASARQHLEAGVLSVREPGSPNHASFGLGNGDGLPTVITAGRFLTAPGAYFPGLAREVEGAGLHEAALEELDHSGGWVKVIGDFIRDSRLTTNYQLEALTETAEKVHSRGGRITMHASIPESIQLAIDAGFDGIEHGNVIEESQVAQMASADMTWTPTAIIDDLVRGMTPDMLGPNGAAEFNARMEDHGERIRQAHDAGVRILAGTDAGMTPHGVVADEIRLLHAFGLPAEAALASGSWIAREYLGLPGIEFGQPADLVIFPGDPREDLSVLDHPSVIMRAGALVMR